MPNITEPITNSRPVLMPDYTKEMQKQKELTALRALGVKEYSVVRIIPGTPVLFLPKELIDIATSLLRTPKLTPMVRKILKAVTLQQILSNGYIPPNTTSAIYALREIENMPKEFLLVAAKN